MLRSKRFKKAEARMKVNHHRSPFATYLKEVMYGAVDGIITTFAIVAGFSGAALSNETTTQLSFMTVLLFGLVNLFGDGVSLGLGNFLAVRSEQGLYKNLWKREQSESVENGGVEARETKLALIGKGFSEEDAHALTEIFRRNEAYWVDFIVNSELKVANPMGESPVYTGVATFTAFISFGMVPLMPFMVMSSMDTHTVFQFSALGALLALIILGIVKWKVVGTHPVYSVLEVVLVGSMAASVAFLIGTFFSL